MIEFSQCEFTDVFGIWRNLLWPDRESAIESHSVMTWPESDQPEYDMSVFEYDATFWCARSGSDIIAVNSGHRTSQTEYRTRGIWVDPRHRLCDISQTLFALVTAQAVSEHCDRLWSLPRQSAIRAYTKAGFVTVGDYIQTETSDANIYAEKMI